MVHQIQTVIFVWVQVPPWLTAIGNGENIANVPKLQHKPE